MEINIYKENEKVYFKIGEDIKEFNYDNLDWMIEICVNRDCEVICNDDSLKSYKELITNILDEIKKEEFKEALKNL